MSHPPTSELVAFRWLQLAVPGPGVDDRLPAVDPDMIANGFLRAAVVGGTPDPDVPKPEPVIAVECWWPPAADSSSRARWRRAGDLAQRVWLAGYNPRLQNVRLNLTQFGDYGDAQLFTAFPVTDPTRVEGDPNDFARYDLNLQLSWAPTVV